MPKTMLADLGLPAARVSLLSSAERQQLLTFLLRWEYLVDLHACLDVLLQERPDLVTLLDLRARALAVQQRFDTALEVAAQRLRLRASVSAQSLLAELHLAKGALDDARRVIQALVEQAPDSTTAWRVYAEIAIAQSDTSTAVSACHRLGELTPDGQSYLLTMVAFYRAQNDWVTASGYAVRLLNTAAHAEELSPNILRKLLAYFKASEEETRVRDLRDALEARHAADLSALQEILAPHLGRPAMQASTEQGFVPTKDHESTTPSAVQVADRERDDILSAVRNTFGFTTLLPGQLETLTSVMRGENTLVILPTGGGKSLCYQLPAILAETGTTLVISPLIALMKDQIDSLPDHLRARATTINSSLDGDVLRQRLEETTEGRYRLLYAAPERLRQPTFLHALRRAGINRLVIDEAHCVSVWGHDFRPDYLKIAEAWRALDEPPILALTATAPPRVRRDIVQHLSPDRPMTVVAGDLIRPNLQFEVFRAASRDDKLRQLVAFCKGAEGSGIIYADTRARCEQLADLLRSQGVNALHYHAGISNRAEVQDRFMAGETRVIVATIAFGMGIDKPDIRFIVHFMPPASLESYYQEAGRAGRDGDPARCLLMVSRSDHTLLTRRVRRDLPTVDFLRAVYGRVIRHLGSRSTATVASADLQRELQVDETPLRVALSVLEENGLLRRGPDAPRAALLRLQPQNAAGLGDDHGFAEFARAAGLRPGEWLQVNLMDVASKAGLSPLTIEEQLLTWADQGALTYRFSGRDMMLGRATAPNDVAQRISLWLDRYATIQTQRIDEMSAYADTDHCRHGYLSAYLGGRRLDRCDACDNCVILPATADVPLPDEQAQLLTILRTIAAVSWGWGRYSLVRILQGDSGAPEQSKTRAGYGALRFRSRKAIEDLIASLIAHSFLTTRDLETGGTVVDLTAAGHAALTDPQRLADLVQPPPESIPRPGRTSGNRGPQRSRSSAGNETPARAPRGLDDPDIDYDPQLFEALRAWRLQVARAGGVPPYVVFHDNHLRAIAAALPQDLEALLAVKGVGAGKLAKYGDAVLALVRAHVSGNASPPETATMDGG